MKVVALWVYPIKGLRGIRLERANLSQQGIRHDRTFMLCKLEDGKAPVKMQLDRFPECALFEQEIVGDVIQVRFLQPPGEASTPPSPEQQMVISVPLEPDVSKLCKAEVNLHQSKVHAYRMGDEFDAWFSACFGFSTALYYIGDGRRPVLGTFSPEQEPKAQPEKGWLASLPWASTSSSSSKEEPSWLTFTDCAPFLFASAASLANVSARLEAGDVDMKQFRPNIVVDGEGEGEWDEDFWAGLALNGRQTFTLTKMCTRCTSVNVDYATGRTAAGEQGTVLKKLMADRRVDKGAKYSPVFGKYGFLDRHVSPDSATIAVGDDVQVSRRSEDRPVFDWPSRDPSAARFYPGT